MGINLTETDKVTVDKVNSLLDKIGIENEDFVQKIKRSVVGKPYNEDEVLETIIKDSLAEIDESQPNWTFTATNALLIDLYKTTAENREHSNVDGYHDFYDLQKSLTDKGVYNPNVINKYSEEEIRLFGEEIDPTKDRILTYPGLFTLKSRYLAVDGQDNLLELPQERWMTIAMTLMQDEPNKEDRIEYVKEAYWALSNLYMTVATPTLANSGKAYGQLSSCFIDTVDDSLQGIYDSNTDIAQLSKSGGGIGVYMGKVRSRGSDIRGHKGASSGVVPWIRQLNNTAVSVDQLG